METSKLHNLFAHQLTDIYDAEGQRLKALPKLAKVAKSTVLKQHLREQIAQAQKHVDRIDRIRKTLGIKPKKRKCAGMQGLVEESKDVLKVEPRGGPIADLAIIAAAHRMENYEVSAYGAAHTLAENLGYGEIAKLLNQALQEATASVDALSTRAKSQVISAIAEKPSPARRVQRAAVRGSTRAKRTARRRRA